MTSEKKEKIESEEKIGNKSPQTALKIRSSSSKQSSKTEQFKAQRTQSTLGSIVENEHELILAAIKHRYNVLHQYGLHSPFHFCCPNECLQSLNPILKSFHESWKFRL